MCMLYVALCWVYTIHVCVYSIGQSLNGCKKIRHTFWNASSGFENVEKTDKTTLVDHNCPKTSGHLLDDF